MKTPNVKHIRSGWSAMAAWFIVFGIVLGCPPSSFATGECLFGEVVEIKGMILEVRHDLRVGLNRWRGRASHA